ncbi:hypothetical protein L6452_14345 [Arctium lappa]|uniref:Uncharacterized protein n=1 Tax=Arctium lappa TaxID=4217 RepID=A0ACB9CKU1_ARCLA|nr:hypothetical protein L6452_14345 [Arctium lappa]
MTDLSLPWKSRAKKIVSQLRSHPLPLPTTNSSTFMISKSLLWLFTRLVHRVLHLKSLFKVPNPFSTVNPRLLLDVDDSGYGGGPSSVGATVVLDFMVEVLANFVTEQIKATPIIKSILEMVPLYVDVESVLVFVRFSRLFVYSVVPSIKFPP